MKTGKLGSVLSWEYFWAYTVIGVILPILYYYFASMVAYDSYYYAKYVATPKVQTDSGLGLVGYSGGYFGVVEEVYSIPETPRFIANRIRIVKVRIRSEHDLRLTTIVEDPSIGVGDEVLVIELTTMNEIYVSRQAFAYPATGLRSHERGSPPTNQKGVPP